MAKTKNKVRYGLNNVHWAKILGWDSKTEMPIYATPVRYPGAVSISFDTNGEVENFYADNSVYYVVNNNVGYSGDFEAALVPEDFAQECLGELLDENGNLVETTTAELAQFALLFEFDGDKNHIRHCLLCCSASRTSVEGSTTEDSKEVQTETITISATPLKNGLVKYKSSSSTTYAAYKAWYKEVIIPTIPVQKPTASVPDGTTFKDTLTISFSCAYPAGAEMSYYLDTKNQTIHDYTEPITIDKTTSISICGVDPEDATKRSAYATFTYTKEE